MPSPLLQDGWPNPNAPVGAAAPTHLIASFRADTRALLEAHYEDIQRFLEEWASNNEKVVSRLIAQQQNLEDSFTHIIMVVNDQRNAKQRSEHVVHRNESQSVVLRNESQSVVHKSSISSVISRLSAGGSTMVSKHRQEKQWAEMMSGVSNKTTGSVVSNMTRSLKGLANRMRGMSNEVSAGSHSVQPTAENNDTLVPREVSPRSLPSAQTSGDENVVYNSVGSECNCKFEEDLEEEGPRVDIRMTAASTLSSLFDPDEERTRRSRFQKSAAVSGIPSRTSFDDPENGKRRRVSVQEINDMAVNLVNRAPVQRPVSLMRHISARVQIIVRSAPFDIACGLIILGSTVIVGLETDRLAEYGKDSSGDWDTADPYFLTQFLFNLWYILELAMRITASGIGFFYSVDWKWNLFDCVLVTTSLIDMCASTLNVGGLQVGRIFRAVRLLRILRSLRIVRVLQYIREFRKMLYSLASSVQTLFWSLLLLLFVMYTFGIWFTQRVNEHLYDMRRSGFLTDGEQGKVEELDELYGSLGSSIYTLYKAISNGQSWGGLCEPLSPVDWTLIALFVSYIALTTLGVLNVVTAVFVESAMQSTQHYRDLMVEEKIKNKEMYVKHMRQIFNQIDTDESGTISMLELRRFILDERQELQHYFEALELNPSDTHALFRLLDPEHSGEINIDEFCDGCLKLKGEARSFDVNCIMYEHRRAQARSKRFMAEMRDRLQSLADHNSFLQKQIMASRLFQSTPGHRHMHSQRNERREHQSLPTVIEASSGDTLVDHSRSSKSQPGGSVRALSFVANVEEDSASTGSPENCSSLLPSAPPSKPVSRASQ